MWSEKKHQLLGYSNLNSHPLLSNDSVNMLPWQQRLKQKWSSCWRRNTTIKELLQVVFSVRSALRLYTSNQHGTKVITHRCGSALRDISETPWEFLYSKSELSLLSEWPLHKKKRRNCRCSEKKHSPQPRRPGSACFNRGHRGLHTDW
jgi:hypothetical protein